MRDSWSSDEVIISTGIISALPKDLRTGEARRHVKLRVYEEKPSDRVPYISLLPWDKAIEGQTPFLRSEEAVIRSFALKCQLHAVKYDDAHISDALQLAIKRQYEQSPVRDATMEGLCKIPASRWKGQPSTKLRTDSSTCSRCKRVVLAVNSHMQHLLARIIAFHPRWAADQITQIVQERGWKTMIACPRLAGVIPAKETMNIVNAKLSLLFEIPLKEKDALPLVNLVKRLSVRNGIKLTREWSGLLETLERLLEICDTEQDAAFTPFSLFHHQYIEGGSPYDLVVQHSGLGAKEILPYWAASGLRLYPY